MKAPKMVFDDLGIHHQREIPLPGIYIKAPCDCGQIHKWNPIGEQSFDIYALKLATVGEEEIFKPVKKCKKCEKILLLELEESVESN